MLKSITKAISSKGFSLMRGLKRTGGSVASPEAKEACGNWFKALSSNNRALAEQCIEVFKKHQK